MSLDPLDQIQQICQEQPHDALSRIANVLGFTDEDEQAEQDRAIGRRWRENSSLETWFPFTAEALTRLEAERAATLGKLRGIESALVHSLAKISEAGSGDDATFVRGGVPRESYMAHVRKAAQTLTQFTEVLRSATAASTPTGIARFNAATADSSNGIDPSVGISDSGEVPGPVRHMTGSESHVQGDGTAGADGLSPAAGAAPIHSRRDAGVAHG